MGRTHNFTRRYGGDRIILQQTRSGAVFLTAENLRRFNRKKDILI